VADVHVRRPALPARRAVAQVQVGRCSPHSSPIRNLQCPGHEHRVNGACGVASRSATPPIDPAPAPMDSAPIGKMEGTRTLGSPYMRKEPSPCPLRARPSSHPGYDTVTRGQPPYPQLTCGE
jgi:hypothetical protein